MKKIIIGLIMGIISLSVTYGDGEENNASQKIITVKFGAPQPVSEGGTLARMKVPSPLESISLEPRDGIVFYLSGTQCSDCVAVGNYDLALTPTQQSAVETQVKELNEALLSSNVGEQIKQYKTRIKLIFIDNFSDTFSVVSSSMSFVMDPDSGQEIPLLTRHRSYGLYQENRKKFESDEGYRRAVTKHWHTSYAKDYIDFSSKVRVRFFKDEFNESKVGRIEIISILHQNGDIETASKDRISALIERYFDQNHEDPTSWFE